MTTITGEGAPPVGILAVRESTATAWQLYEGLRRFGADLVDWTASVAADGRPMLSVRVTGRIPIEAMRRFVSEYALVISGPDAQRPAFDYDEADRVSCVWRTEGVWVVLWARDTGTAVRGGAA